MLTADLNMGATDRAFQHRPETVKGIGMRFTPHVFLFPVLHHQVLVAFGRERAVRVIFVRGDSGAFFDIGDDMRNERVAPRVRNDSGNHVAAAFDHAEHGGLFDLPAKFGSASV